MIKGVLVHEDQVVPVVVEVLHRLFLDVGLFDFFTGPERALDRSAVQQVLHLGSDEGSALTWLDVLEVRDRKRRAIELNFETVPEL